MITFTEKEVVENGITYMVREYSTGSVVKWQKQSEEVQEPQTNPITNEDIMDKLNTMTGEQVAKADLDTAYREGVNSYGE